MLTCIFLTAIPLALLAAYFRYRGRNKLLLLCSILCAVVVIIGLVFESNTEHAGAPEKNHSQQWDSAISIARTAIKPFVKFSFSPAGKNSHIVTASVANRCDSSISRVDYEIKDDYTVDFHFCRENGLENSIDLPTSLKKKRHDYLIARPDEVNLRGSCEKIGAGTEKQIFEGRVNLNEKIIFYTVKLTWERQSYTAVYMFFMDKTMKYRLTSLSLFDAASQAVTDLGAFLQGVPESDYRLTALPDEYQLKTKISIKNKVK